MSRLLFIATAALVATSACATNITPMPHPDTMQRSLAEMAKRSLVGAGCDQTLGGTDFKYVSNLAKLKLPQPFYHSPGVLRS